MKIVLILLGVLAASIVVYCQAGFTVTPKEFPTYHYQVWDIGDLAVPASTSGTAPTGGGVAIGRTSQIRDTTPAPSRFSRSDRGLEEFFTRMGSQGYRLVQIYPNKSGQRAVFEREYPGQPKRPPRQ